MKKFTVLVVVALVLAACGGGNDPTITTVVGGDVGDTTTTPGAGTGSDTTTTVGSADTTTTRASADGDTDACLVGTWNLDAASFFAAIMASMSPEELQGATFEHVGGEYQAVMEADGTFIDRRVDWTFAVTSPMGDLEIIVNHERTGEWGVENGTLFVNLPPGEPADQQVFIDGEPFEFPGGAMPFSPPAVEWLPAGYECAGDTLSITAEGVTSTWERG